MDCLCSLPTVKWKKAMDNLRDMVLSDLHSAIVSLGRASSLVKFFNVEEKARLELAFGLTHATKWVDEIAKVVSTVPVYDSELTPDGQPIGKGGYL